LCFPDSLDGNNWGSEYLGMLRSNGNSLRRIKLYTNNATGWAMRKGDQFWVADANKDGKKDLFVYNPAKNWLGMIRLLCSLCFVFLTQVYFLSRIFANKICIISCFPPHHLHFLLPL
jgi:hypothetical protein